jgi:undecaprenyl-diphosphatase
LKRNTLLTIASALSFTLFGCVAWWAHKHPVDAPDFLVTHGVQKKQNKFLRYVIMAFSTITASAVFLNILAFPTAVLLWWQRLRLEAVMTAGTSWLGALLRFLIQRLVNRPRPNPLLVHVVHKKSTPSFPSGHVTTAVTFWGWLLALGMMLWKGKDAQQKGLLSIPGLLVVLTGPARVYLGEHWTTDVLGGYLFGGGWVGLCFEVYLYLKEKRVLGEGKMADEKPISWSHW